MSFKVGFSEIPITPKTGTPMGGYSARLGNSTGIHDDLFARGVYFNNNGDESLIIAMDILSIPLKVTKFYRKLINQKIGIEPSRIFICALHNHSGPDTMGIIHPLRGFFRPGLDMSYFFKLGIKLVKLAQKAKNNSQEAVVGADKQLMEKRLIINRRAPLKDSKFEVGLIRFDDLHGNLMGLIINYACHGTVLPSDNTLLTAEYPGYLVQRIKDRLGKEFSVIYLNGPCADLNPNLFEFNVNLVELDKNQKILYDGVGHAKGTFARAKEIGYAIADKAIEISKTTECSPVTVFIHTVRSYSLPMRDLLYDNTIRMHFRRLLFKLKVKFFKFFWRIRQPTIPIPIDVIRKKGKFVQEAELHGLRINNIGIIGIPGELFLELGNKIIKNSSIQHTFVTGLANGYLGYLYPIEDYKKGGYELFLSSNPLAGTLLTNEAIKILNSL